MARIDIHTTAWSAVTIPRTRPKGSAGCCVLGLTAARQLYNQEKLQWPYFMETEMNDLIVFLYSLNYLDKPGDAVKGEKIFAQKKCIECHFKTVEDKQKLLGAIKAINTTQFAAELWNHTSAMEAAMMTQGVPWPEMTGAQLRDVLAFLQKQ